MRGEISPRSAKRKALKYSVRTLLPSTKCPLDPHEKSHPDFRDGSFLKTSFKLRISVVRVLPLVEGHYFQPLGILGSG